MLNFCSLYSGSTGNSLFIESNNSKILIDSGVSVKKIVTALSSINVDISQIDAILVTHEHSDHVQSLGTLSKKYNIPVYANKKTWEAMPKQKEKIDVICQKVFNNNEKFEIEDLEIKSFSTPHDAADSCGFTICSDDTKISIATDLGHITTNIIDALQNSKFLLLESNYDPEVLKCCSYPYLLKSRILGPNGHLSNSLAGKTIAHLIKSGLQTVMLGHLSKENNFPELAYNTVLEELALNNYTTKNINVSVASRFGPTNLIQVS